jgi:nucleoside-diphosphate-sugar epimerase
MSTGEIRSEFKIPTIEPFRRALVTGCGGVLGYALVQRLLADGWHVTGTTRSGLSPFRLEPCQQFLMASVELTNRDSIDSLLLSLRPDIVFHLAACNDNSVPETGPMTIMMTNIFGTMHLLEAVRIIVPHALVVLTSSIESAYAMGRNAAVTPYRCSKLTVELLAKCYHDSYGISCGVIQLTSLYGPGDRSNRRLVPYCMRKLAKNEPIDILSPLNTERDFLYAEDAADALLLSLENVDFLAGKLFSVSSGSVVRIGDLVSFLMRVSEDSLDLNTRLDIQFGKNIGHPTLPKWSPKWTLEKGLIETWNWFKNN